MSNEQSKPEWMNPYSMPIYPSAEMPLATGGVIEPGQIATTGDGYDRPEVVYVPKNAPVIPAYPAPAKDYEVVIHKYAVTEQVRALIREEVRKALSEQSLAASKITAPTERRMA